MTKEENHPIDEQDLREILLIRREKLKDLQEKGKNPFVIEKYKRTHQSQEILNNFESLEGQVVSIAGRMLSKRGHGKAGFAHIQDMQGRFQIYVRLDQIGEESYQEYTSYDVGDIIGVTGEIFKTKRGEVSLKAQKIQLLTKSLQPLPEKWHGLKDPDLRYRQRYVDLIVNPEVKEVFIKRTKIIQKIREFLDKKDYLEVETPILQTIAGGANARPFVTHHNTLDIDMYLRIANELFLKRLIVGGFDKVYEMGRMFRNEGMSYKHNPEYTAIELYEAYADYNVMMEITENLVEFIAKEVLGATKITYGDQEIELKAPWARVSMHDLVAKKTGIDFMAADGDDEARILAKDLKRIENLDTLTKGEIINIAFEEYCESDLKQPTFVLHHPVDVSPLAKRNPDNPIITNRFEAFILGREIANGFSELNDPIDQKQRFMSQLEARESGDEEAHMMDEDFVHALEVGLPPTAGLGIGVDRLIMFLTNTQSIRDVLLFPTMKPLDKFEPEKKTEESTPVVAENVAEKIDFSKVEVEPLFQDLVEFDTFAKSDFRAVKVKECVAVPKSKKLLKFVLDDGTGIDRIILSGIHDTYEPEELVGKTLIAITNLPPRKMMGIDSNGMIISAVHHQEGVEKLHCLMVDDNIPAGAKLY